MKWKLLVGATLAAALIIAVSILYLDRDIALYCDSHFNDTRQLFWLLTKVGNGTLWFTMFPLLFVYFRWIKKDLSVAHEMLFIFTSIAASGIMNSTLKFIFGRYRPYKMLSDSLYGFTFFSFDSAVTSFPSGHANLITALALSLSLVFPRLKYVFLVVALLVMMSRVVVGVHFLSDVVFGAYVAGLITLLVQHIFEQKQLLPARS
mgnify:CR=1 FL=1